MIKDAKIEDVYLKFTGKKGYYTIDLGVIDMFGKSFSNKTQIITSNGRTFVETVEDEEYNLLKDLILSDSRFLKIDEHAIVNIDNIKRCSVRHDHLDLYSLDIQFFHSLNVLGSKEECEQMKSMIDNAMKLRIEEYQASTTMHDTGVESNL